MNAWFPWTVTFPKDPEETPKIEKPVKTYQLCRYCQKEMAPDLDSYWGKDPLGDQSCVACRKRLNIK